MIKPPHLGDLVEARDCGKMLNFSSYNIFELLPSQVQIMWNQRSGFSECEICMLARSLQASINSCRLGYIVHLEHLAKYIGQSLY